MGRTPSKQRKQKKSKKDKSSRKDRQLDNRRRSYSSDRSNSRKKSKDRKRQKDRKKTDYRDRDRNKRDRSKSFDKSLISKDIKRRSRQRSRSKKREQPIEDEDLAKKRRLAMVKMLCMDDEDVTNIITSNQAKEEQKQPTTAKVQELKSTAPKKKSRWQKTGGTSNTVQREPMPVIIQQPQSLIQQKAPQSNLSLDGPFVSDDKDAFKVSESIDVQDGEKNQNPQDMDVQDDPLQAFMKGIQDIAVPQLQLTQAGKQNCISYEDIVTSNKVSTSVAPRQQQQIQSQKFRQQFLKAITSINTTQVQQKTQVERQQQAEIIDEIESDEENQAQEDDDDNFLDKQKRLAERKQFNSIDHSKIKYQQVRFNLYRQSEQIKDLTKQEVEKYRKDAGDIKVRGKDIPNPVFNWYQCGLSDKVLEVIQERKYKRPFPIQAQSFPLMMSGRDVIGIAQTGSGKTMAYMIPVIKHIQNQRRVEEGQGPIALIMTPTRQLTRQVYSEFKSFCKPMGIRVLSVYGGLNMQIQLSDLKKGAEIIICTPGRMIDVLTLNNGKVTNLRRVTMIVIDEADRMFDLGFQPQITKVLNNIRPIRQTVMFSATFPKNVESLAKRILKRPAQIIVGSRGQACANIDQIIEVRQETSKLWRLLQLLGYWNDKGSIIIFVDKKSQVDFLFRQLLNYGYHSLPLHSGMDATDRQFTIYDYKRGIKNILIATSICSRGLDIKNIVLVVNFKCPNHLQDYIHRIGRTGRAGNKGTAITFITPQQQIYSIDMLKALQMADVEPPAQLKKLAQTYLSKVKKGEARKIRNRNMIGSGYKFNQQEEDNDQSFKDIIKKQLKAEGLGAFDDSDDEDLEKQKKRQEDKRGRSNRQKAVQALKDPELKQKLLIETAKALNIAINEGTPMTTDKIIKLAVQKMKQQATKHVVIKTAKEGQQAVLSLVDQFQKTNPNGPTFSYDYEINDFPPNARSRVTTHQFLSQIKQLTNCTVSTRGQYYQAGRKIPHGSRKLYLHIQGQNKSYVSAAFKQIKRMLTQQSMQNYQGQLAIKYGM